MEDRMLLARGCNSTDKAPHMENTSGRIREDKLSVCNGRGTSEYKHRSQRRIDGTSPRIDVRRGGHDRREYCKLDAVGPGAQLLSQLSTGEPQEPL